MSLKTEEPIQEIGKNPKRLELNLLIELLKAVKWLVEVTLH